MYMDLVHLETVNSDIKKLEVKKNEIAERIMTDLIGKYLDLIEEKKDKMVRGDYQHILEDLVYNARRIGRELE